MATATDFTKPKHKELGFKTVKVQLPSGLLKGYIYRYGNLIAFTEEPAGWEQLEGWTTQHIKTILQQDKGAQK